MAKEVSSSYHVFLSFRGPDTREKFTCLLYDALTRAGYITFMDDEDIRSGEGIDSRIRAGIKCSMSAIIVFSENYAYSKWCLDELVLILERKRTSNYMLLPIYYEGVEPADIKYQRGSYGDALEKHKKRHGDKIEKWKAALEEVGDYKARIVAGKLDKFLTKIVKEIGKELSGIVSMVNPRPSVNPQLGGIVQGAAMPYWLNLHPNLGHMGSHFNSNHGQLPFNVTMSNPLDLQQQQPQYMPPPTHDSNNTEELDIKEDATDGLQIKVEKEQVQEPVEEAPSWIEPSDPLVGYPKKCPPGGKEKVVIYTSLAAVKSMVRDCLKVKKILERHQLDFEEREETKDPKFRDELHNLVGGLSYPRLFVMGREMGGVMEVEMLHKNGQLNAILQYCKQQLENARRVSSLPHEEEEEEEDDDDDEDDEEEEAEAFTPIIKMTPTTSKNMFIGCPIKCPPGGKDKVVLYTWFTAVVTSTTKDCLTMKKILKDYNVNFEERDAKKDPKFRNELQSLVGRLSYPRLFVMGRNIGDVKKVENMKKTGQLGSILLYFKRHQENAKHASSLTHAMEKGKNDRDIKTEILHKQQQVNPTMSSRSTYEEEDGKVEVVDNDEEEDEDDGEDEEEEEDDYDAGEDEDEGEEVVVKRTGNAWRR